MHFYAEFFAEHWVVFGFYFLCAIMLLGYSLADVVNWGYVTALDKRIRSLLCASVVVILTALFHYQVTQQAYVALGVGLYVWIAVELVLVLVSMSLRIIRYWRRNSLSNSKQTV